MGADWRDTCASTVMVVDRWSVQVEWNASRVSADREASPML